jgi:dTMP kinase
MSEGGAVIVLEGIDGAGKTTLAPLVAELVDGRFISRKTVPERPATAKATLNSLATALWESGGGAELPTDYWLHLQLAWYTAFSSLTIPAASGTTRVVIDGWYYKFLAKLVAGGCSADDLLTMFRGVTKPTQVVLLVVDADAAWRRRSAFRDSELGAHAGYETLGENSFIDYQTRVSSILERFAIRFNWKTIRVTTSESADRTAMRIAALLAEKS